MINNHNSDYTSYPSFNKTTYANLRENNEHNNSNSNSNSSNKTKHKLPQQTSTSTISHATRIEPTNLSYNDLLRTHQFTPQSGDSTPQTSPMKQEFDLNNNNNNNNNNNKKNNKKSDMTPLELERETFRHKTIIEEPKKPVSGYQLFAKWKRREKPDEIDNNYPQSKALSIEWNALTQQQREEWNKKADQGKIQYQHQKQLWLKYVQEAKRLGIPVPTKSVKPMIQQIKIKNLLNLIPDICKTNKETTFLISKATEMFIQYYASKAIEIQGKTASQTAETESFITSLHCFDALQTSHQFNFLRAVTVKPSNHKKNVKKRKRATKKDTNNNTNEDPPKKKRKLTDSNTNTTDNESNTNSNELTNQIITNHTPNGSMDTTNTVTPVATYPYGYPQYITAANGQTYAHGYYQPHNGMINAPFQTIYQPPNPFTHTSYSPKYAINNNINNTQTQIVNVQQIFGSDE